MNDLATSRVHATKRSTTGVSVRFFRNRRGEPTPRRYSTHKQGGAWPFITYGNNEISGNGSDVGNSTLTFIGFH